MTMVGGPRDCRPSDVVRAIRAVRAAGVENPSVRIRTPTGTEYFFGGEVGASKPKKFVGGIPDPGLKTSDPVRASASLAKGGEAAMGDRGVRAALAKGGATKMFGRGDRTIAAREDSAGKQQPGSTAHKTSSRGSMLAEGGSRHGMFGKQVAGPAQGGRTGKGQSAATS